MIIKAFDKIEFYQFCIFLYETDQCELAKAKNTAVDWFASKGLIATYEIKGQWLVFDTVLTFKQKVELKALFEGKAYVNI